MVRLPHLDRFEIADEELPWDPTPVTSDDVSGDRDPWRPDAPGPDAPTFSGDVAEAHADRAPDDRDEPLAPEPDAFVPEPDDVVLDETGTGWESAGWALDDEDESGDPEPSGARRGTWRLRASIGVAVALAAVPVVATTLTRGPATSPPTSDGAIGPRATASPSPERAVIAGAPTEGPRAADGDEDGTDGARTVRARASADRSRVERRQSRPRRTATARNPAPRAVPVRRSPSRSVRPAPVRETAPAAAPTTAAATPPSGPPPASPPASPPAASSGAAPTDTAQATNREFGFEQ